MSKFETMTVVISSLALLISIISVIYQIYKEKKNKEPKVFIRNKKIETTLPKQFHLDWGTKTENNNYHSVISMKLNNLGKTSLIIDNYFFILENAADIKRSLDKLNKSKEIQLTNLKYNGNYITQFNLNYTDNNGNILINNREIRTDLEYGDKVIPGDEFDIFLPKFFFILTNYIIKQSDSSLPLPKLRLFVKYQDINRKQKEKQFIIEWGKSSTTTFNKQGIFIKRVITTSFLKT